MGHLAAELAGFVADAERCGIVIVTSAEEMPVQEAVELTALVGERLRRTPECVVVNGLYPHNHGMWNNHGEMPAADETFFHRLQKAGYCTGHIGKSHYYDHVDGLLFVDRLSPLKRGIFRKKYQKILEQRQEQL